MVCYLHFVYILMYAGGSNGQIMERRRLAIDSATYLSTKILNPFTELKIYSNVYLYVRCILQHTRVYSNTHNMCRCVNTIVNSTKSPWPRNYLRAQSHLNN